MWCGRKTPPPDRSVFGGTINLPSVSLGFGSTFGTVNHPPAGTRIESISRAACRFPSRDSTRRSSFSMRASNWATRSSLAFVELASSARNSVIHAQEIPTAHANPISERLRFVIVISFAHINKKNAGKKIRCQTHNPYQRLNPIEKWNNENLCTRSRSGFAKITQGGSQNLRLS